MSNLDYGTVVKSILMEIQPFNTPDGWYDYEVLRILKIWKTESRRQFLKIRFAYLEPLGYLTRLELATSWTTTRRSTNWAINTNIR